ncbi:DUF4188 domain-containing protein [Paenibacillus ginsengarvi]|uniref:DUF4188 domain-containing protein n=1 Tax=Paenibacillus ginsengarvi TaxID=400777 RepID=A0A3B0C4F9_9BACL|nr:DUF4188 domain-containing protein [Paenibacillus ginsengarvi]RKN79079.1 DUF4188 domain-containing protein [Paenibacillus ginsengarvi]
MAKVIPGRYTARMEGDFVVFMIGMRINRLWAVHKWLPVLLAMGPMIKELYTNRKLGFRGTEFSIGWRSVHQVQYWDSYEQLEAYARGGQHLVAWRNFNRKVGTDGTVGIYHETYKVKAGDYECVYGNMPVFGLAKVSEHVAAVGRMETSRRRLGGENEPAVPTPVNPE